jgi:hypothetical protein
MNCKKTVSIPSGEALKRAAEVVFAIVRHGHPADEAPAGSRRHKLVDEHGNLREVYAPPGQVTRWP